MHIGILQTDSVLERFQPGHGDYPAMFRRLLSAPAALPDGMAVPSFEDIDVQAEQFPEPRVCDAYVITGSRHSVYDDLPWITTLVAFVRAALDARRPVVGICFGHQLLAHHFGGETRAAAGGWCVGVQRAQVVSREHWMEPPAAELKLLASHKDQVVRLPPGARRFAAGDACPEAGFVLGRALAIQGHPEFSRDYAGDLMDMREQLLGDAVYRAGKASLAQTPDSALVAGWMLRFMAQAS